MPRPELGPLAKGDIVLMRSGRLLDADRVREMTVVSLGPKWVGLADHTSRWFGTPEGKFYIRRFLLADQREGERSKRIGYGCSFATREQHEYDVREQGVANYLRDVLGVDIMPRSPLRDPEVARAVVSLLHTAESSWRPPSE